jgi:mRNA interferase MazF
VGLVNRFDVVRVALDPTRGSEIRKARPCLIVSPDEANAHLRTLIVAPMATGGKPYPTRVPCRFDGRDALVALDQIRTVDKARVIGVLGRVDARTQAAVLATLGEMFAP